MKYIKLFEDIDFEDWVVEEDNDEWVKYHPSMIIKVGDNVKLREDSRYYNQAKNHIGNILVIDGIPNWIEVNFENGYTNVYQRKDLYFHFK